MFKKLFLVFVLIGIQSIALFAKEFEYEGYNWVEDRKLIKISEADEKEKGLILKDKRVLEYVYNASGDLDAYRLIHKIIRVNSDEAISTFNQVYISMNDVISIIDLKVRVITKDGKTIILNKENIKEVENLENAGNYKIFAIEGVEKDSEIEYFYILHQKPDLYGNEELQTAFITRNSDFELISPINLSFVTKSYNGLPEAVKQDTVGKKKQFITLSVPEINSLTKEEFSIYEANKMRINYKLFANGKNKVLKWSSAAQDHYKRVYYWENKKELKPLVKFMKPIGLDKASNEEEKIIMIENYIKNNISINDNVGKEGYFIETILSKKVASKFGILRLMAAVFTKAGISHQIVLTSDRSNERFDHKFEYYGFLTNYVIYFDNLDKYIAPYNFEYRYPFIPHFWTFNFGMFLKPVKEGGVSTALDEIKFIPATDQALSAHNHYLDVSFKPNFDGVKIKYRSTLSGHSAVGFQAYIGMLTDDKRKELGENLVKSSAEDAKIANLELLNYDMNTKQPVKPFEIKADLETNSVIEKAGTKYILKVGDLIGRQSELYQNTKRQLEVENPHNHSYDREIKIKIPTGYKITNLSDLNLDLFHEENGIRTMAFTSSYKQLGDEISISVIEYYKNIVYPLAIFENFRKVVNAAADFNKISLVFERN